MFWTMEDTSIFWQMEDDINIRKPNKFLNLGKVTSILLKLAKLTPACPELGTAQAQLVLIYYWYPDDPAQQSR